MNSKNNFSDQTNQNNQYHHSTNKNLNFINYFSNEQVYMKLDTRKLHSIAVSQEEILNVCHLTQLEVAKKLGISVTMLKRRFHKMNIGRWPGQQLESIHPDLSPSNSAWPDSRNISPQTSDVPCFFRKSLAISVLINKKNQDEKYIDPQTPTELNSAFR